MGSYLLGYITNWLERSKGYKHIYTSLAPSITARGNITITRRNMGTNSQFQDLLDLIENK